MHFLIEKLQQEQAITPGTERIQGNLSNLTLRYVIEKLQIQNSSGVNLTENIKYFQVVFQIV